MSILAMDISEIDISEMTSSKGIRIQICPFSDKPPFLPAPFLHWVYFFENLLSKNSQLKTKNSPKVWLDRGRSGDKSEIGLPNSSAIICKLIFSKFSKIFCALQCKDNFKKFDHSEKTEYFVLFSHKRANARSLDVTLTKFVTYLILEN
jgi:hypothetical protein